MNSNNFLEGLQKKCLPTQLPSQNSRFFRALFFDFVEITLFCNKKKAGQQVNGIPSAIFAGEDQQIGLVA